MSGAAWIALLLAAVALGSAGWRARSLGWRDARSWLPLPVALLLGLTLFPPTGREAAGHALLLTPGAEAGTALPARQRLLALPGVEAPRRAEAVPDLGTALRRHPELRQLTVVGSGLPARDRDALAALGDAAPTIDFVPAPIPGIVEVDAATQAELGRPWTVAVTSEGAVARVELRDPSGATVDDATPDADGRLRLSAPTRAAGRTRFEVAALDADGALVDRVSLPLNVLPAPPPIRVVILAGGPDPELKYLRRWATDAGLHTAVRIALSDDLLLREGEVTLTAEGLADQDVLIIDDRAWAGLADEARAAIAAAVDGGMGLLLRITGELPGPVAADWAALGYRLTGAASREVGLIDARGRSQHRLAPVALREADDAAIWLRGDDGAALVWIRAQGSGRIALSLLTDSFRLRLAGDPAGHAALWADLLGAIVRPAPHPVPPAPRDGGVVDQRARLCGLPPGARLRDDRGSDHALLRGDDGCADWWPPHAGWFAFDGPDGPQWLYVRAEDDGRALRQARDRAATQGLATSAPTPPTRPTIPRGLPFVAWLALSGWLWWRERAAR